MNNDTTSGAGRKIVGKAEEFAGRALKDDQTTAQGLLDQASGSVQKAVGQAKDAVASGASGAVKAVSDSVGTASESISQSAAAAQDQLMSFEADLEKRIQRNPWTAVLVAVGVGLLIGKMSS
jgi:uncharacterized protein YjbJ (UPF0337 family)